MDKYYFEYYIKLLTDIDMIRLGVLDRSNLRELENSIISMNDPYLSCRFLTTFPDEANEYKHVAIITSSLDPVCNYLAALEYPNTELAKITVDGVTVPVTTNLLFKRSVIMSGDPEINILFARDIDPISIPYIKYKDHDGFDRGNLSDYEVKELDEAMDYLLNSCDDIKNCEVDDIKLFALDPNYELHREVVKESGDERLIKKFDKIVSGKRTKN